MQKISLPNVTFIIVDGVNYDRAKLSFDWSTRNIEFGEAKILTHLPVQSPEVVPIKPITSIEEYSKFMIRDLTHYVNTEYVLVGQWDGFVWNADLWTNEFLQYDYIGAPWPAGLPTYGAPEHFNVGNGGFSLRSKKLLDILSTDINLVDHWAEDVVIGRLNRHYLEKCGIRYAPTELATRFSLENGPMIPAFGCHARLRLVSNPT